MAGVTRSVVVTPFHTDEAFAQVIEVQLLPVNNLLLKYIEIRMAYLLVKLSVHPLEQTIEKFVLLP
jgi:hypothetical protein